MNFITSLQISSAYHNSYTFSDDDVHRLENNPDVILTDVNIHCYTNAVAYGNATAQEGIIQPNAVIWFDSPFKPFDWLFKNNVAGANGKIVIIGTLPLKKV